jgi:hypothetical protein
VAVLVSSLDRQLSFQRLPSTRTRPTTPVGFERGEEVGKILKAGREVAYDLTIRLQTV